MKKSIYIVFIGFLFIFTFSGSIKSEEIYTGKFIGTNIFKIKEIIRNTSIEKNIYETVNEQRNKNVETTRNLEKETYIEKFDDTDEVTEQDPDEAIMEMIFTLDEKDLNVIIEYEDLDYITNEEQYLNEITQNFIEIYPEIFISNVETVELDGHQYFIRNFSKKDTIKQFFIVRFEDSYAITLIVTYSNDDTFNEFMKNFDIDISLYKSLYESEEILWDINDNTASNSHFSFGAPIQFNFINLEDGNLVAYNINNGSVVTVYAKYGKYKNFKAQYIKFYKEKISEFYGQLEYNTKEYSGFVCENATTTKDNINVEIDICVTDNYIIYIEAGSNKNIDFLEDFFNLITIKK